jgi:ethanolamine utilization protein EutQ (cupin superfamily)
MKTETSEKEAGKEKKKVKIDVDNHPKHVAVGTYRVSDLKDLIEVPADKDLDQVIDGNLTTLLDDASVTIKGGEVFFSHVRRGGSS